ncbi:MAG TPA: MBL fold metallo-hydrolase [Candidatus Deferrimicrobium sp.]|nr:MBL fold metallo-hydrolase [Candidatus Deferrimicrobium sp.]
MAIFRETGQVAEGVYLIDTGIWGIAKQNAVYVIQSSNLIALIDTSTKRETKTILNALDQFGIETLDFILVTHSHIDHCGAIYSFAEQFPKATICLPSAAKFLNQEYFKKCEKLGIANPFQSLKEGAIINLDDDYVLEVIETPGHISDHLSFLERKNHILFVGDACGSHHLGEKFSRPTAYAPYFDHSAYIKTLLRFQTLNPAGLAIASYGFASKTDAHNCIQTAIHDYYAWKQTVIDALQNNYDESHVAEVLLQNFGRSPGETQEKRSDQWVKTILTGIARGFIHSLGLQKI